MLSKRDLVTGGSALLGLAATRAYARDKTGPQPTIVQIPIGLDVENRPVVTLFIGGKGPYRFMIDTGAFGALIRQDLAEALKLDEHGALTTTSLAGQAERSPVYRARDVMMGGVFRLPSLDMVAQANIPHAGMDGILPASVLTALKTELDFEKAMVRYYLEGAPQDLTGFVKLDSDAQPDYEGGAQKIYAHVRLDGRDLLCLIDTGAAGHILLSGAYVQDHDLWSRYAEAGQSAIGGVNGRAIKTRIVKVPNFEFGPMHFNDTWVTLGDPEGHDTLYEQGIDGVIGCDILRQFTLAFAEHHQVFVKPNRHFLRSAGVRPTVKPTFNRQKPVLSFTYTDDRRILIGALAGKRTAEKRLAACLVNTGAAQSDVADDDARSQGLAKMDGGFDGSAFILGGWWHPPHWVLAPRPATNRQPYAIDLGLDFLTAMTGRLDFDTNELTLFMDTPPDLTGYSLFATRQTGGDGRFYVTARLAGVDTSCLIDTSAPPNLTLLPHAVEARHLWDAFPEAKPYKAGTVDRRLVKMTGLDIGGRNRDMAPVLLVDPSSPESFPPCDAILGMGFLHNYNWTFTPDGKLYAKPNGFWNAG